MCNSDNKDNSTHIKIGLCLFKVSLSRTDLNTHNNAEGNKKQNVITSFVFNSLSCLARLSTVFTNTS